MKLPYSTKKWEKEIKAAQAYDGITATLNNIKMLQKAYDNRKNGMLPRIEDEVSLYFLIGSEYEQLANYEYLLNNEIEKSLEYMVQYIELSIKAYSMYKQGEMILNTAVKNRISDEEFLNELAFSAIAIDRYDMVSGFMSGTVIDDLYNGNYKEARARLSAYNSFKDEDKEVYFKDMCFLKKAILELTERNDKAFSDELESRIRKYRKNMVGYSTIIDTVSVALIKLAQKAELNVRINVIEIPEKLLIV